MSRLEMAIDQIKSSREYMLKLLETIDPNDWFRMPSEGVTHIGWQVAHLAMADYRLCLERIRGKLPEDEELISGEFLMQFGRDSVPNPDPAQNPSREETLGVLTRVREQVLLELPQLPETELDEPPLTPHRLFNTKLGALIWCAQHEMIHVGQMGLLRRLFGQKPAW